MLTQSQRLRNRRDFRNVYTRGRSFVHPVLVLYVRRTASPERRIGYSVSKKLGGAVERNRVKRRLREACRAQMPRLVSGFDAVFVARGRAREASYLALKAVVDELFQRARLFAEQAAPENRSCGESAVS